MAEMSQVEATAETSSQANTTPPQKGNPVYEIGFHVVPTVGEEGVHAAAQKIRAELEKVGAEIIKEEFPVKKILSYTIERSTQGPREKYTEAYFGWIKFAVEREAIPAIEAMLRGAKEILRFLLIETVREEATPAPRRAVFTSDRLEGETIHKPVAAAEKSGEVSEEDLDKSIEALVS